MAKPCGHPECIFDACSHGYCWNHQNDRTDEKWLKTLEKRRAPRTPLKKTYKVTGKKELFDRIKRDRTDKDGKIRSWLTGKEIAIVTHWNFAHVVPAGSPEYKDYCALDPDDVVILTEEEHTLYDQGTIEKRQKYAANCALFGIRCDWDRLYQKKMDLITKYDKLREQDGK